MYIKQNLVPAYSNVFCFFYRYGEKWSKKWAQEAAYIKIHAEIPDVLSEYGTPVNTKVYPDWSRFLEAFLSQGKSIYL